MHSNFPLLPEHHRQGRDGYEISLNDYRYRVRTRTMGRQMLHRKMVGGGPGRHFGELTARDYALGSNIHMEYDDGTVVDITSAHTMSVRKGDMLIAKDNEFRCIPLNSALYLYSQVGDRQTFMLPPQWRGRKIDMVMLTKDGPEIHELLPVHWHYVTKDDRIDFHWMPPYVPYKVTLA